MATIEVDSRAGEQVFFAHKGWLGVVGVAVSAAFVLALLSSTESLWVDELHTAWTVEDSLASVYWRAEQGNQQPLYFWGVWVWLRWVGDHLPIVAEVKFRMLSIAAWCGSLVVCAVVASRLAWSARSREAWGKRRAVVDGGAGRVDKRSQWSRSKEVAVASILWLGCDRIQLFYASEARVYACVQFLSLLAWWAVWRVAVETVGGHREASQRALSLNRRWLVAWTILAIFLMHLHVLTALALVTQWATGVMFSVWRFARSSPASQSGNAGAAAMRGWCWAGLVVVVGSLPVLWQVWPLWARRQRWQAFAGDASWESAFDVFPVGGLVGGVVLALLVNQLLRGSWRWSERDAALTAGFSASVVFWAIAAFGPWVMAWLITLADLAPVLHRRYLLFCSVPLVLFSVLLLQAVSRVWLRWLTVLGVGCFMLASQGTLQAWGRGDVIGWYRLEGWRAAVRFIDRRYGEDDLIWCASGLIEGNARRLPLRPQLNEYLSYPLRSIYRVDQVEAVVGPKAVEQAAGGYKIKLHKNSVAAREAQVGAVRALVNESQRWSDQWRLQPSDRLWIIARQPVNQLESRLKLVLESRWGRQAGWRVTIGPRGFGRVSVARLSRSNALDDGAFRK